MTARKRPGGQHRDEGSSSGTRDGGKRLNRSTNQEEEIMGRVAAEVRFTMDEEEGGPRVEVVMPEKTAAQRENEARWDAAMEEAFGAHRKEIPEALWMTFGTGTDKQRLAKGVTVPQYGRVHWYGYSRHFTTSDGERLSLSHGVSVPWPNHNNGYEHHLATLEPGDEADAVLATYHPAYAVRTRKTKRPEPRTKTFPEPIDRKMVRAVQKWLQEQIDADPFAQAFSQEEAGAKREREKAHAAELAEIEAGGRRNVRAKRKGKARASRVTAKPFTEIDEVVVVDVETTGLDPNNDRIVEVAAARGDLSVLLRGETKPYFQTFEARVNPGMPIPEAASRIHGIHDKDVRDEDAFAEIAAQLREFIGTRTVIGHNSTFDTSFLNAEFERAGVEDLTANPTYCTMRRFRQVCPGEPSSLDAVAGKIGRERSGRHHGALEDTMLTIAIAGHLYLHDNDASGAVSGGKERPETAENGSNHWWFWGIAAAAAAGIALMATVA